MCTFLIHDQVQDKRTQRKYQSQNKQQKLFHGLQINDRTNAL